MRLIDLDKALTEAEDECRMSDDWKVSHEMINVFKYQPTVKAIPIEWLTKYLHELDKQAEEQADFIINELGGYGTCYKMEYATGIKKMLEKWEKENEQRIL